MCLGIPGQLVDLPGDWDDNRQDLAQVDVCGVKRTINVGLLSDETLEVGDWILIHVGFALSKIDEEEARASLGMLAGMGQAYTDELAALAQSVIE